MANKKLRHLSAIAALVSTLLGAYGAHAGPLRYDDGSATGNSGVWDPQQGSVGFGDILDLDFNFDFFGGTARRVQVNNFGELELLNATGGALGSIRIADLAANPELTIYGKAVLSPLPALDDDLLTADDPVTAGFRVQWTFDNGLQAQLALFALGSGGSLIEFNYLAGVAGLNLSTNPPELGLVNPLSGTGGFSLTDYLTASQPSCLTTFGRGVLVADPAAPTDGCTSYFVDSALKSVALPTPFNTTNGGPVGEDALADYRYLLRYAATTTPPPPTTVPEPAVLTLLVAGFAALAATRRKRRDA